MKTDDELTIAEAKNIMRPKLKKGTTCLCCGQRAQVYARSITSSMVHGLIHIYLADEAHKDARGYIHLENFFKDLIGVPSSIRGDLPKLRFWGFLEVDTDREKDDGNPNNGYYRITQDGKLFVLGHLECRQKALIYNNKLLKFDPESKLVRIKDCVKNKFNYEKLINNG